MNLTRFLTVWLLVLILIDRVITFLNDEKFNSAVDNFCDMFPPAKFFSWLYACFLRKSLNFQK